MELKNQSIKVRASEREADALKKLAQLHDMTPSEFLRDLLRKAARQAGLLPELTVESQTDSDKLALAA